jgi:hypothetical protein
VLVDPRRWRSRQDRASRGLRVDHTGGRNTPNHADSFHRWWDDDLGRRRLDAPTIEALVEALVEGVAQSVGTETSYDLAARRDATLTAVDSVVIQLAQTDFSRPPLPLSCPPRST